MDQTRFISKIALQYSNDFGKTWNDYRPAKKTKFANDITWLETGQTSETPLETELSIELNPPVIGNAFRILTRKKYRDHTHWAARYDFVVKPHQTSREDSEENLSTEENEDAAEAKRSTQLITGGMILSSLTFLLEATSCVDYLGDVLVLY